MKLQDASLFSLNFVNTILISLLFNKFNIESISTVCARTNNIGLICIFKNFIGELWMNYRETAFKILWFLSR